MTEPNEEPLPQVPVILLCAEDDDLELVSFVHEARQHGLEPEVVPGVEDGDRPLLDAMRENDEALFVVLRSDNLTGERTLALKRAFGKAQKKRQHLLALRLDPERSATAVRTIARRLQQLMAPKGAASPRKPVVPAPSPKTPEVDEWAGTLIHEKPPQPEAPQVAAAKSPSKSPSVTKKPLLPKKPPGAKRPSSAAKPPTSKAAAPSRPLSAKASTASEPDPHPESSETVPGHTWSGTLIADESDAQVLADGDRTPLPGAPLPSAPTPAELRNTEQSEAQWGGTLIADPSMDFELTIPQGDVELGSAKRAPVPPAGSHKTWMLVGGLIVVGVVATAFALGRSSEPEPVDEPASSAAASQPSAPEDPQPTARPAPAQKTHRAAAKPKPEATDAKERPGSPPRSTDRDTKADATELPSVEDAAERTIPDEPVPLEDDPAPAEGDAPPSDALPSVDTPTAEEKPSTASSGA